MFHAMKFLLIAAQTPSYVEYDYERPSYNPHHDGHLTRIILLHKKQSKVQIMKYTKKYFIRHDKHVVLWNPQITAVTVCGERIGEFAVQRGISVHLGMT